MAVEIHSSYQAASDQLADYIVDVNSLYELELVPSIKIPGTTASDHSRFWNNGYAAVLLIEEYFGGDFNPYYHSEDDRIGILNMPYFHEMAKLSIGSLASMANPVVETTVPDDLSQGWLSLGNHPNPFRETTTISFTTDKTAYVRLTLYNSLGNEVAVLEEGIRDAGTHRIQFSGARLPEGLYFLNLQLEDRAVMHKIILQ
jgi:hypothetical protein